MKKEDIIKIENDFISGVLRAKQSGYDGVVISLNGDNGNNLINYFLSPEINKRKDEYGGNNRVKILKEIIEKTRIELGYEYIYKSDWKDLPGRDTSSASSRRMYWPLNSVSSAKNSVYNVNGALVFEYAWNNSYSDYQNPFENTNWGYTLYDYKFNIVDENGKELFKGNRHHLTNPWSDGYITIAGIPIDVMDLIDEGKAFINPVAVYLKYGK